MVEIGKPEEEREIQIIPREDPVPKEQPAPKKPAKEPVPA